MKTLIIGLLTVLSLPSFASFSCPEMSRAIYNCKGLAKTATSDELKDLVKKMLVCSSSNSKYSLVIEDKKGKTQVLAAKKYQEMEMTIFEVISEENLVPVLEINTLIDQKNGRYTDFLMGGEIILNCLKTR